jgi:hypothetical protein
LQKHFLLEAASTFYLKQKRQTGYRTAQLPTVACFRTWRGSEGAGRTGLPNCKGKQNN